MPAGRRYARPEVAVALLTALMMVGAYYSKMPCFGTETLGSLPFHNLDARVFGSMCYSDIQALWDGRHLGQHLLPYVHGGLSNGNTLAPGTLEYPVLSGLLVYVLALPASTQLQFFQISALFLGLCGILTSVFLARMVGWRSLWFALAPSLVLYSFLNWDLSVVLVTVAAILCVRRGTREGVLSGRWLAGAAVLLGVGGSLKFYPLMFAAPVALYVLFDSGVGNGMRRGVARGWAGLRWRGAGLFLALAASVFVAINLPFVLIDFQGWLSAYAFQWSRPIDATTQSIWYWGLRPLTDADSALQPALGQVSTAATALGLGVALASGLFRVAKGRQYPWLEVSAAMLSAYLVLNKVHSPQYVLWLLPFLVLLRVRAGWVIAYLIADVLVGTGWYFMLTGGSDIRTGLGAQMLVLGVWGRPALLVGLCFAYFSAGPAWLRRRPAEPVPALAPEPAPLRV
ncbi:hypothetical protein [Sinomonas sp. P10A9]|uniref:DUF2029 domain-containing protein n=1 Tax=Sinomonas puerhi TaxID=3238584 RepID=A0AB39L0Y2_9MICC